ncbi:hypothetical protein OAL71_02490, partial [Phycisphaerales bacterium]|nr:hypothetical protein [Phycisphaerales bacterium]
MTDPEYNTAADPGVDFVKAVARLKGGRLLLVGDLMLDEMIRGAAERLSPDAPVPVLSIDGESAIDRRPGGTGNVAVCLKGLEAEVSIVGLIGDDEAGRQL